MPSLQIGPGAQRQRFEAPIRASAPSDLEKGPGLGGKAFCLPSKAWFAPPLGF